VHEWLTPREVARGRRIRVGKVLAWIRRGELRAVNHAENRLGRPRWRISAVALENFDRLRLNAPIPRSSVTRQHRRRGNPEIVEFF
jgi:hypothetical protein